MYSETCLARTVTNIDKNVKYAGLKEIKQQSDKTHPLRSRYILNASNTRCSNGHKRHKRVVYRRRRKEQLYFPSCLNTRQQMFFFYFSFLLFFIFYQCFGSVKMYFATHRFYFVCYFFSILSIGYSISAVWTCNDHNDVSTLPCGQVIATRPSGMRVGAVI